MPRPRPWPMTCDGTWLASRSSRDRSGAASECGSGSSDDRSSPASRPSGAAAAIGLIVGGIWFNWRLRSANATLAHTNSRLDQANTALGQSNRQLSDSLDETKLQRERAIRNLYAADMDRARRAVDGGLTSRALELLNGFQNPDPGLPDLRGFEWYYLHKLCSGGMRTIDAGGGVSCVAASSDGRLLAGVMGSPAEDKPMTLRIWDAATGRALHTLNGHQDMIMRVAFDTTGKKLASAGWDGTAGSGTRRRASRLISSSIKARSTGWPSIRRAAGSLRAVGAWVCRHSRPPAL